MDDKELKALQDNRRKLATEMKRRMDEDFHANDGKWKDDEARTSFEAVDKDYRENLAKLDAGNAQRVEASGLADRQAELDEDAQRSQREHQSQKPGQDLGQPSGVIVAGREDKPVKGEDRELSVQAWLRAGDNRELKPEHVEACERTGVNPHSRFIDFKLHGSVRGQPQWSVRGHSHQTRAGLDVATSGAGPELIPQGFQSELERTLQAYGGPRNVARILRTDSGNDILWPSVDDTSNTGALLSEATSVGGSVDPTYSNVTLKAYKYSSKPILISTELLEDSAFQMGSEIGGHLGERTGRITATHFTTGDNTGKPQGLVPGASAGITSATDTAIASDELFNMVHSLDPAYRSMSSVGWMFHDNILLALRKLKDGQSQYLWQEGMSVGAPDKLLGYPITINQDMQSSVAATTVTVLFGAYEKYIIRDVTNVRAYRLEERYRDLDQTGFVTMSRHDGRYINTAAVKKLTQAA